MNDFWGNWTDPPRTRKVGWKLWRMYITDKSQRTSSKSHWHWAVVIPTERFSLRKFKFLIWFPFSLIESERKPIESDTDKVGANFLGSQWKELHPGLVIKIIFGLDDDGDMIHVRNSFFT
jgi:hypothetical protein